MAAKIRNPIHAEILEVYSDSAGPLNSNSDTKGERRLQLIRC